MKNYKQLGEEYIISANAKGGDSLTSNGSNVTNTIISSTIEPTNSTKWIFESAGNNKYYIKSLETNRYIYINNGSGYGNVTADVTLSTSNKTAFSVSGTSSLQISCQISYRNFWGGTQTATVYIGCDNSGNWNASNNYYNDVSTTLYLLTYELYQNLAQKSICIKNFCFHKKKSE